MTVWPHVFCFDSSWNKLGVFSGHTLSPISTWTLMTMTFSIPAGTTSTQIHFDAGSTGTFQVDNVISMVQPPNSSPSPTSTCYSNTYDNYQTNPNTNHNSNTNVNACSNSDGNIHLHNTNLRLKLSNDRRNNRTNKIPKHKRSPSHKQRNRQPNPRPKYLV